MRCCLFYAYNVEKATERLPFSWEWIQQWCQIYKVYPVRIDTRGSFKRLDSFPYNFRSIEEAVDCLDSLKLEWVWLDHEAEEYWDEVELPDDDVIYCIGDDVHGFHGYEGEGQKIKMPPFHNEIEESSPFYASMVVPPLFFTIWGIRSVR